jgi:23S rRNA pseudouridine1911/1915/1917 synthase
VTEDPVNGSAPLGQGKPKLLRLEIAASHAGKRLDLVLAALFPDYSRMRLNKLVKEGAVLVNGRPVKPSFSLKTGQNLSIDLPPREEPGLKPAPEVALKILHEDADIIVVDKSPFIAVHPGAASSGATLIEALLAVHPELALMEMEDRCGVVHRLDKDTSGVLLVARNSEARKFLSRKFAERRVKKRYLAFVRGNPPKTGFIDRPIGRHPTRRHKMAAGAPGGRAARTGYRVLRRFPRAGISLVSLSLFTGRTHQARVHLAAEKFPVLGDSVYGSGFKGLFRDFPTLEPLVKRQCLHARRLTFPAPRSGERLSFASPWPEDFTELYRELVRLEEPSGDL